MIKVTSKVHADNDYSHDGKTVRIKGHARGAETYVTDEDMAHLAGNSIFQQHKANGFIAIEKVEEPAVAAEPAEKKGKEKAEDTLLGTALDQPASFELEDGSVVQLSDVIRQAFTDSGLTAAKWNKLAADKREELIQATIDELPIKKATAEE